MTRDNSTNRICTCVVCLQQFTPFDRRSKGRICAQAACRKEWNRRAAMQRVALLPKREPKPKPMRITPICRGFRTILQPQIAPYLATLAAATSTRTD